MNGVFLYSLPKKYFEEYCTTHKIKNQGENNNFEIIMDISAVLRADILNG
jgi:hypothetical protein